MGYVLRSSLPDGCFHVWIRGVCGIPPFPAPQDGTTALGRMGEAATQGANGEGHATVIAEQVTEISLLSVSEAVMRMDLADQPVLMFRNTTSGELNVVYRRSRTATSAGSIRARSDVRASDGGYRHGGRRPRHPRLR